MMCETMANIPVENKTSYVLTEDMIDAAMNEQFSYQEDIESEGDVSSVDESINQDSQESYVAGLGGNQENCRVENQEKLISEKQDHSMAEKNLTVENNSSTKNLANNVKNNENIKTVPMANITPSRSPVSHNNKVSVLVIETGLDRNNSDCVSSKDNVTQNESTNRQSTLSDTNLPIESGLKSVGFNNSDSKENLTILKSILSNDKNQDTIIDLCESEIEADDSSEEDMNETEAIDDELKSVMETNLMAEIGMSVNKKAIAQPQNIEKESENTGPRISVKNIAHISSLAFNSIPTNGCATSVSQSEVSNSKLYENQCLRNVNFNVRNPNYSLNIPVNASNQNSNAIHINKIAVPHSSFLNNKGQRMKCVYVKTTSNLPFVINTPTQTTATNANMKYVFTQPVLKKGPVKMPAIAALKSLTKNTQPQQTLLLQKNAKVFTLPQKIQTPSVIHRMPPLHYRVKSGPNLDFIKNSLIQNSLKKNYTPPDTFPEDPVYSCECNDKFLSKKSLSNHIERHTMNIRYWCKVCNSELLVYNRCALSLHMRGHNLTLKHVDNSCLSVNPILKDVIEKGVATTFLKDSDPVTDQSVKSTSFSNNATQSNNSSANSVDSRWKPVSIGLSNVTNHIINNKITTISGQSKGVCFQSPNSSEVSSSVSCDTLNSHFLNKKLPFILPKTQNAVKPVALVSNKTLPNNVKEQCAYPNKPSPKSLILFCNKLPPTANTQLNSAAKQITTTVCEADTRMSSPSTTSIENNDSEMIVVDQGSTEMSNKTEEEEIVDVENFEGNVTSSSTPKHSESEKTMLDKGKKNTSSSFTSGAIKRNCSECKAYCANISKHLNQSGRPQRADLACRVCNLILPSKCSLKIHSRVHMKIPPFKCPDCGKDFTAWDELHSHLKFSCGHFAKCVRFICKGCKAHFPTQNGLAHHIVKNHGKDIFKCSLCPVAFYKKTSLLKHITNDHANEKNKSKLGMDYKQCEMCPKKLLPEESYLIHAKEHSNAMIYGYKCSMCNIVYANKMAFIIHQIKEKTKKDREGLGKSDVNSMVCNGEPSGVTVQASDSNSDFEDEPVIIRKYPENYDESSIAEKDPLSLDDFESIQEQKVKEKTVELCIVCKKNSVVLLPGIDLNNQSLCCKQCVKPLDCDSSMESSKNMKSHLKSNNFRSRPKSIYRSSSTDEINKKVAKKRRTSDISMASTVVYPQMDPLAESPSRKKSRKKQKDKFDFKGQTHIQGQVIKSRSQDELSLKCSKCKFVTEKRESFLEHIRVHRIDPNTYQCLECGLCFVVLPSLERHLQMHHGIKDSGSYIENNKESLPQKAVHVEEKTEDNQCRVCYERFDCKSSLDKHFRIHGMAFMSRLSKSP